MRSVGSAGAPSARRALDTGCSRGRRLWQVHAAREGTCARQREVERGPLVNFALGPRAPAMARDDAPDVRETDPGSFEGLVVVQPLEHTKELARVLHVE